MNDMNQKGDAGTPRQTIGDQNVDQLLRTAYCPEEPRPAFAEALEKRLLERAATISARRRAGELPATREGETHTGRQPSPRLAHTLLSWWRWGALAAAAAAVLVLAIFVKRDLGSRDGDAFVGPIAGGQTPSPSPAASPSLTPGADRTSPPAIVTKAGSTESDLLTPRRPAPPVAVTPAAVGALVETRSAERRRIALADGSIIFLNSDSAVKVEAERRLSLLRGEIYVEVAPRSEAADGDRAPFVVRTPHRQVTALGTRFSVREGEGGTSVFVTQGRVKVSGLSELLYAGSQLHGGGDRVVPAPRPATELAWAKDLMQESASPMVPAAEHQGGALVAIDPQGQQMNLSLRRYHVDVHIEDGYARTTIDQTYFNHQTSRLEGTFYFPLPPDASLNRLAMYVDGKLMEGGMAERDYARQVFESIVRKQKDPALLEWMDGSTFKMRVFPLEGRQEKRIILSYIQKLPAEYGKTEYRFPAGHSLESVKDWSFAARIHDGTGLQPVTLAGGTGFQPVAGGSDNAKDGTGWKPVPPTWSCPSHPLKAQKEGGDLLLTASETNARLDRDVVLNLYDPATAVDSERASFRSFYQDGAKYLLLRYRPAMEAARRPRQRDWIFLFESGGDRNPLLAGTQVQIVRSILEGAEHNDRFAILSAATRTSSVTDGFLAVNKENIQAATENLLKTHLVGALDLTQAFAAAAKLARDGREVHLVHVGCGTPILGERRQEVLVKMLTEAREKEETAKEEETTEGGTPSGRKGETPSPRITYVGIGVGKRWNRSLMRAAAAKTGGLVTQINPDENVSWRSFELLGALNTPRLLDVRVIDSAEKALFLCDSDSIAHGQELSAVAQVGGTGELPRSVVVTGILDGKPYSKVVKVADVKEGAGYAPRVWAKMEIDRLIDEGADKNRARIVELSKSMYVMSPFTSLIVLENEAMYQQYNVDRGRKDHWAMYPAPPTIPVVYEPLGQPAAAPSPSPVASASPSPAADANALAAANDANARAAEELKKVQEVLSSIWVRIPPRFLRWPSDPGYWRPTCVTAWQWVTGAYAVPYYWGWDNMDLDIGGIGPIHEWNGQLLRNGLPSLRDRMERGPGVWSDWNWHKSFDMRTTTWWRGREGTGYYDGFVEESTRAIAGPGGWAYRDYDYWGGNYTLAGSGDVVVSGGTLYGNSFTFNGTAVLNWSGANWGLWRGGYNNYTGGVIVNGLTSYDAYAYSSLSLVAGDAVFSDPSARLFTLSGPVTGNGTLVLNGGGWMARSLNTTVTIPDGGTLLRGGQRVYDIQDLMATVPTFAGPRLDLRLAIGELEREKGAPLLDKIPILRRLFTNTGKVRDEQTILWLARQGIDVHADVDDEIPWYELLRYPRDWREITARRDPLRLSMGPQVADGDIVSQWADAFAAESGTTPLRHRREAADLGVNRLTIQKLARKVPLVSIEGHSLENAINWVQSVSGISIRVKWDALAKAGVKADTVIRGVQLTNATTEQVLRAILDKAGASTLLAARIENGQVVISTRDDLTPLLLPDVPIYQRPTFAADFRVFSDLLAWAPGMNTSAADIQAVLEAEGPGRNGARDQGFGTRKEETEEAGATPAAATNAGETPAGRKGGTPSPREANETHSPRETPATREGKMPSPRGRLDTAARELIEKARAGGWRSMVVRRDAAVEGNAAAVNGADGTGGAATREGAAAQEEALTMTFDGGGRFVREGRLASGLVEKVYCDGATLLHLYPELGVGARRTVSRFHRAELSATLPMVLPPAEDLTIGADVTALDGRTVAISPRGAAEFVAQLRGALAGLSLWPVSGAFGLPDANAPSYLQARLIFADDGRLAERQAVLMPAGKALRRETYDRDGAIRVFSESNELLAERKLDLRPASAPDLRPDVKDLVVLPMPIRTREAVYARHSEEFKANWRYEDLKEETALELLAADTAVGTSEVYPLVGLRFFQADPAKEALSALSVTKQSGRRIGFYTLLCSSGAAPAAGNVYDVRAGLRVSFDPVDDHPASPLAAYVKAQWESARNGWNWVDALDGGDRSGNVGKTFLGDLAGMRTLFLRWNSRVATQGDADRQKQEHQRVLDYVNRCRAPAFAWTVLCGVLDSGDGGDSKWYRSLAGAFGRFPRASGLTYYTRYESARALAKGGDWREAANQYASLYRQAIQEGALPPIDSTFVSATQSDGKTWQALMRETASALIEKKDLPGALVLACQCLQLDQSMGDELLSSVLTATEAGKHPAMGLAVFEVLWKMGRSDRAEQLLKPAMEDKDWSANPYIWRLGWLAARQQGKWARAVRCLEKALDIEYAEMGDSVDLRVVRQDYGHLLDADYNLAKALKAVETETPKDLVARIVRAADRWRRLEQDDTAPCQAAARALAALGEGELAWEYLTTPLAEKPNESAPWLGLAQQLRSQGDLLLADRAYESAFAAEPTNAQILWDHAQLLQLMGQNDRAHRLYRQIAEGPWEPRFESLKTQAKQYAGQ